MTRQNIADKLLRLDRERRRGWNCHDREISKLLKDFEGLEATRLPEKNCDVRGEIKKVYAQE